MNFLFAKLFEQYQIKSNPSKEIQITGYIGIVYFLLFFVISAPINNIVNKVFFHGNLKYNDTVLILLLISIFGIAFYSAYYKYIKKKRIYKLVEKYKNKKINIIILYFTIILLPAFFILLGGTLGVLATGGKILNYEIDGFI